MAKIAALTENQEQIALVKLLDAAGLCFFHVPNSSGRGGIAAARYGHHLKRMGRKPGVPDVIILNPPPLFKGKVGTTIEMKRVGGIVSDAQMAWMDDFDRLGWITLVTYGCGDAVEELRELGYVI